MIPPRAMRIVIISDQAIYMRGLMEIILSMSDFSVIGQGENPLEALQLCQICEPDIAIFSFAEPVDTYQSILYQVKRTIPSISIICMSNTNFDDENIYTFSKDLSEEEFKANLLQVRHNHLLTHKPEQSSQHRFEHQESSSDDLSNLDLYLASSEAIKNNAMVTRELEMAGRIQKDILPEQVPEIPGWEISATLIPARETSGDFYDFIPLTEHKWGIVIADVIDKGMGAALFMALSSTLIRTYASRFPTLPALTLNAVSNRILKDTRGGMFVTAVYCVLEPLTGRVIFSNAGHPPGVLVHTNRVKDRVETMRPTGMALGVSEDASWKQKVYRLNPADILIFYTDGVTEAENEHGISFGEERIWDIVLPLVGSSAKTIQNQLVEEVLTFSKNTPHQDDIAIIVIRRLPEEM